VVKATATIPPKLLRAIVPSVITITLVHLEMLAETVYRLGTRQIVSSFICPMGCSCRLFREAGLEHCIRSFGFELSCSAFASWRARKRHPKTFSLAAHNRELVLGQSWTSKRSRGGLASPPRPSSFAYRACLTGAKHDQD